MRRIICAALAAAVILSAGIPAALAAHHGYRRWHTVCQPAAEKSATEDCRYADEDQDGVCDRCDGVCYKCGEVHDQFCDGICDGCESYPDCDYETVTSEAELSNEESIPSGAKSHHGHRGEIHKRGHH